MRPMPKRTVDQLGALSAETNGKQKSAMHARIATREVFAQRGGGDKKKKKTPGPPKIKLSKQVGIEYSRAIAAFDLRGAADPSRRQDEGTGWQSGSSANHWTAVRGPYEAPRSISAIAAIVGKRLPDPMRSDESLKLIPDSPPPRQVALSQAPGQLRISDPKIMGLCEKKPHSSPLDRMTGQKICNFREILDACGSQGQI